MFEEYWAIPNTMGIQAWKILREAEQNKKDNGKISELLRSNLQNIALSVGAADREAIEKSSTDEVFDMVRRWYTERARVESGDIRKSIKKTLGYLGDVEPAAFGSTYRQLQKAAEKAKIEKPAVPGDISDDLKKAFNFLVDYETAVEDLKKGRTLEDSKLPEALKPEELGRQITNFVIEASYTVGDMAKDEGVKKALEEINTKLMTKKKPEERLQTWGDRLHRMNIEKISNQRKAIKKMISSFTDNFTDEKLGFDQTYHVMDRVGGVYRGLGEQGVLERDYVPVTTLDSLV